MSQAASSASSGLDLSGGDNFGMVPTAPVPTQSNLTTWLIAGGIALALVVVLVLGLKRK